MKLPGYIIVLRLSLVLVLLVLAWFVVCVVVVRSRVLGSPVDAHPHVARRAVQLPRELVL